uniref:Ig-like domain-containing protein n=1 Tax=Ornithorhynchus anatinus TaxID=9258 RepID=A0A6I8PP10_ORNAN
MLGSITLLLTTLLPAVQTALTLDQPMVSITQKAGTSATFPCEFSDTRFKYIHWYRQQPGQAPQRLLYYNMDTTEVTLESGVNKNKIHAYKSNDGSCFLFVQKLDRNDAGFYYCAGWVSTLTQFPPPPVQKVTVRSHEEQGLNPHSSSTESHPLFQVPWQTNGDHHRSKLQLFL